MSSKKYRKRMRNAFIERIKPAVVLQYGNEIGNALMEAELESVPLEQRAFARRLLKMKYFGHGYQFMMFWAMGNEPALRFIIPSGKVRVRNVVIYFERGR